MHELLFVSGMNSSFLINLEKFSTSTVELSLLWCSPYSPTWLISRCTPVTVRTHLPYSTYYGELHLFIYLVARKTLSTLEDGGDELFIQISSRVLAFCLAHNKLLNIEWRMKETTPSLCRMVWKPRGRIYKNQIGKRLFPERLRQELDFWGPARGEVRGHLWCCSTTA